MARSIPGAGHHSIKSARILRGRRVADGGRPRYRVSNVWDATARVPPGIRQLPHVVAAVHVQDVTGNVRGHWGGEEQNCVHDLVSFTKTTQRNLFDEVLCYFIRHTFAHADIDETGRDRIDGDLVPRQLARRNLRERDDGGLARRVVSLTEKSHLPANG